MITEAWVWVILFVPLGSFVTSGLIIRPFFNRYSVLAGYVTIVAIGVALALSIWALRSVVDAHGDLEFATRSWLEVGNLSVTVGILLDPLTAIMLVVVTGVSLLVQIYSVGYMKGDLGYARYYAYMSLFTASMVGLILSANIIQFYVFWELVGASSYLLIGFWYHKPSAAAAAKKAFIVTRIGDFGFLLAILYLVLNADVFAGNGLEITTITTEFPEAIKAGLIGTSVVTWVALGIFAGAIGKSGQLPLHTWLPDAMEGPTPVSALIHAATMVAAGVFLVARFFPLFEASEVAMNTMAIIGGVTAVFAASMALVATDIKRVLAYSTISQLGYMMLALGVGAYSAAIFHLFTHAFFKALLFLGSGSVNHATGTFDMRYMGGLRKVMPWTYVTFIIGALSIAGIFPLAGFWSKDEILADAWRHAGGVSQVVFWLGLAAVFMTAFYMFRVVFMTFGGEFRGGADAEPGAEAHGDGGVHLVDSPAVMVVPLVVLAFAAVVAGFLVNPTVDLGMVPIHWLSEFLGQGLVEVETPHFNFAIAAVSSVLALAGIALAYVMYSARRESSERMTDALRPFHILLLNKYYFDEFYENYVTRKAFYGWTAGFLDWADKAIVDGFARMLGYLGRNVGGVMAHAQTGQLQGYGVVGSLGVLAIVAVFFFLR